MVDIFLIYRVVFPMMFSSKHFSNSVTENAIYVTENHELDMTAVVHSYTSRSYFHFFVPFDSDAASIDDLTDSAGCFRYDLI